MWIADCWKKGTYEGVADSLENKYGIKFSKTTIQRALDAMAAGLEPEARNMRDILKDADYIGYDEAPYPVMGKSGWARVAASHVTTSYHLAASAPGLHSRSMSWSPAGLPQSTCMDVTRRCWAHILRDAAAEAWAVEKAGMELTYCRVLLEHLKCLYRTAKKCPRGDHATYVRQALEISRQHTTKFAQTLAKAAPDLFTFILYDLEPTNNHSERTMRFVVGHRNVRMQVCSMWRCNTLWTCISVWRLYWNCTSKAHTDSRRDSGY